MTTVATSLTPEALQAEPLTGNYFVAAYPPFSCWHPCQNGHVKEALLDSPTTEPLGLYIHVPFCKHKCDYCYYLSYVGKTASTIQAYLDSVVRELALYAQYPAVSNRPLAFVYFGGGTPSLLSVPQVRRLIQALKRVLPWDGAREVTYECAPRSVRPELLEELCSAGVTRLSMGVQSFDNSLLKINGRIHLAEDALRAYQLIRQWNFDWVNLDLMVGLIGETPEKWYDSVRKMIELAPDSVTIYQTEIPCNTQLYRDLHACCLPAQPVSWEVKRHRLNHAFTELEQAGYTVVSAYAAVKDSQRHRFAYQQHLWRGGDMLGLGVGSFSYFRGVHFQNHTTLEQYHAGIAAGSLPLYRTYQLGLWDQMIREFVLQLKWGEVNLGEFEQKFGIDFRMMLVQPLQKLAAEGYLILTRDSVRLTRRGLLRVDRLLTEFYDNDFQFVRYT